MSQYSGIFGEYTNIFQIYSVLVPISLNLNGCIKTHKISLNIQFIKGRGRRCIGTN